MKGINSIENNGENIWAITFRSVDSFFGVRLTLVSVAAEMNAQKIKKARNVNNSTDIWNCAIARRSTANQCYVIILTWFNYMIDINWHIITCIYVAIQWLYIGIKIKTPNKKQSDYFDIFILFCVFIILVFF